MSVCGAESNGADVLADLILPSRVGQHWKESGMDSLELCRDKQHFLEYPFDVEYSYNSRGFRDAEWPIDIKDLKNAIWCIGDSFTVGLGCSFAHTWPQVLQARSGIRTINISLDGGSNDWISRRARQIQDEIAPKYLIVMWSFLHRRENKNRLLDDERRRIKINVGEEHIEDLENFKSNIDRLSGGTQTKLLQFIVPGVFQEKSIWQTIRGPDWPLECPQNLDSLPTFIKREIFKKFKCWNKLKNEVWLESANIKQNVKPVLQLDFSRDGFHFDFVTAQWIADQILPELTL